MISFPTKNSKEYLAEYNDILAKIDNNILHLQTASNKDFNPLDLKDTNQLISSASLILAKIHGLDHENTTPLLEEKYAELAQRKKQISELTSKYQINLLQAYENKNINENLNEKMNDNYDKKVVGVNLITDYNEKLLGESIKNLNEVRENLQETAINMHGQGSKLVNANDRMEFALNKMDENNDVLGDIACSKKCQKLWMIIVNILLFSIIVLIILMKILKLFK